MAVAGSLTYDTKIDNKGFQSGLSKLGGIAKTSFGAVTGAVAGAATAVGALVTSAVKGYAEYEQLVGGVDTLFKDSSQKLQEYANQAYKTAGLSANDYMSTVTSFSASLLQSLGGDTEKAADYANQALIDMSDNANKMGTSMESIQWAYQGFAKQNYTMLDNLKLGYGGTKEEMQRLLEDAQKLTGVKYDISNFGDVTQAIHAIQTELGITGTTAKEASSTIEGSFNSMKAAWNNLMVGMASPDTDWETLINNLVDTVKTFSENLIPVVKTTLIGVSALIRDLFPMLAAEIPALVAEILPQLVETGASIVQSLMNGIQQNLPLLISSALQIITTIAQTLLQMLPQILEMGLQIIIELIKGIAQQAPTLVPQIVDCVILIVETLVDNLDLLVDAGIELLLAITLGIIEALPKLIDKVPEIINKLFDAFMRNLPKIIDAGVQIIIMLIAGLINAIPNLIGQIPNLVKMVFNALTSGFQIVWQIGKGIVTGIWNGISNAASWLWNKVSGWCNTIVSNIKNFFGIHSPSTLFRDEIGKMMPQGLAVGIDADTDKALKAIDRMDNAIYDEMSKSVDYSRSGIATSGINGTVNQMLTASARQDININNTLELDGEKVYENQQQVSSKKELQYAFV